MKNIVVSTVSTSMSNVVVDISNDYTAAVVGFRCLNVELWLVK